MNPYNMGVALFAFCGLVAVVPAWMWFVNEHAPGLPTEARFMATFALPVVILLFIAGWIQPGGA